MLPRLITGLSELAPAYDALLCDIWGVLHDGRVPFPAAVEALRRFRATRGPVVLLSNSPRTPDGVVRQFESIGVPADCYDSIVSSGGAVRRELEARGALALYYIGPERDAVLLEALPIRRAAVADAQVVLCTGLVDDANETPDDYADVLAAMRARDLVMLCANPDLKVHRGAQLCWCAGALARDYAAIGGQVVYYGKPYLPVYDLARAGIAERRILAVGDGLFTDVKGANAAGLDVLFIADGLHGEEVEPYTPEHLAGLFAGAGVTAMAACRALQW